MTPENIKMGIKGFEEGILARKEGKPITSNPYKYESLSIHDAWSNWECGWKNQNQTDLIYSKAMERSEGIVDRIIFDISNRSGIGDEWYNIDHDIQQEIKTSWMKIVADELIKGDATKT